MTTRSELTHMDKLNIYQLADEALLNGATLAEMPIHDAMGLVLPVRYQGSWFYAIGDASGVGRLPGYIQNEPDAREYIDSLSLMYRSGVMRGAHAAKRELQQWLNN